MTFGNPREGPGSPSIWNVGTIGCPHPQDLLLPSFSNYSTRICNMELKCLWKQDETPSHGYWMLWGEFTVALLLQLLYWIAPIPRDCHWWCSWPAWNCNWEQPPLSSQLATLAVNRYLPQLFSQRNLALANLGLALPIISYLYFPKNSTDVYINVAFENYLKMFHMANYLCGAVANHSLSGGAGVGYL